MTATSRHRLLVAVSCGVIALSVVALVTRSRGDVGFRTASIQGQAETLPGSGNSLDGFQGAFEEGVRAVEADFRLNAEGVLFAAHSPWLSGNCPDVAEATTAQLRACRLVHGYRTATLPELLAIDFDEIYLDLKDTAGRGGPAKVRKAVERAIRDVRASGRAKDVVLMVYQAPPPVVAGLHRNGMRAGLKGYPDTVAETAQMTLTAARHDFELVCVNVGFVTPEILEQAAKLGVWHLAWKGDPDIKTLETLASSGLGGLITKRYQLVEEAIPRHWESPRP